MCSLDFFFKPEEEESSSFFELGNFRGLGCRGSSQERKETVIFLFIVFVAAIIFLLIIFFVAGALCGVLVYVSKAYRRKGVDLAKRCDHLVRAIVEYDEYCAKRGIRGRAETFDTSCIEGTFLDVNTLHAWLTVNNLQSNIEGVDNADSADLLPTADEFIEIENMRHSFNMVVATIKATKQLPDDMDMDKMADEADVEPPAEEGAEGANGAAAPPLAMADTPHQLISARLNPSASRLKSVDAAPPTPGQLTAATPPPEPETPTPGGGETDKLLKK